MIICLFIVYTNWQLSNIVAINNYLVRSIFKIIKICLIFHKKRFMVKRQRPALWDAFNQTGAYAQLASTPPPIDAIDV
jgi:hypothetical protein